MSAFHPVLSAKASSAAACAQKSVAPVFLPPIALPTLASARDLPSLAARSPGAFPAVFSGAAVACFLFPLSHG